MNSETSATIMPATSFLRRTRIVLPIALILVLLVAVWNAHRPDQAPSRHAGPLAATARPTPLPPPPVVVAPRFAAMTADQARAFNKTVPFQAGPLPAARPFVFGDSGRDRGAALTCLATAILYEAGDRRDGEKAVAQVVLNRVRHPAFPKTICGVVFQGSGAATGCQFTFTCDGALDHAPNPQAWARAKAIADAALSGFVDKAVGTATHYHADYVVPYWQATLDKLAEIDGQIFYRWRGWWGRPGAFVGTVQPFEQLDPRIVALAGPEAGSPLPEDMTTDDGTPPPPRTTLNVAGVSKASLNGAIVRLKDDDAAQYILQLRPAGRTSAYLATARALCQGRPDCLVMGWTSEAQMPRALPILPTGMRGMAFLYRKSSILGTARGYFNCRLFPGLTSAECLPGTL